MTISNNKNTSLWLIVLFAILSIPFSNNEYFYYFVTAILAFAGLFRGKFRISFANKKQDLYPITLIFIWLFGILVGLIRHNPTENIVRNFAGTACYLLYYTIPNDVRFNKEKLANGLIICSAIACLFVSIASLMYTRTGSAVWPFYNVQYNIYTKSLMATVGAIAFVLEATSVNGFFRNQSIRSKVISLILFGLSFYAAVVANNMGGYLLGFAAILWISVLASFIDANRRYKYTVLIFLFIISVALAIYYAQTSNNFIGKIFSTADAGNVKRLFQIDLVINRFKIFGNGIGAAYSYSFGSRTYDTYSVEVSYLNCIDKYGILSIPVIAIMIKSITIPIKNIWNKMGNVKENLVAIALMGYLFIALGNPVLFAPYNVIIHCLSLTLSNSNDANMKGD